MTTQAFTNPQLFSRLFGRIAGRREYSVLALLVVTVVVVGLFNHSFLALGNIEDITVAAVPSIIIACGLTFVVLLGEIDISVGSLLGLLATVMGEIASPTHAGLSVALAIVATLLLGAGIGLLNGVLVAFGRMPSIIVTLGMLTVLRGINLSLINGQFITDLPPALRIFGIGTILGIPISLWTAAIVVCVAAIVARDTPLGRRIYASGSNPDAARLAGLPVRELKVFVFTLTGFLTAVAAVVSVPRLGVIDAGVGQGLELLVVTCVVVGGTSISGGRGSVMGSVLASLLLGVIGPMLIFLKLATSVTYWERAIQGVFILAAVLTDHLTLKRHGIR